LDLSTVIWGSKLTIRAWRGTITPPGKEVPAGKYLGISLSLSLSFLLSSSFSHSSLFPLVLPSSIGLRDEGDGCPNGTRLTYPPYFNTVISGIAAPNGKLLFISSYFTPNSIKIHAR
jgi:hypothetical protein